jgi:hypothetical protein
MALILVTVIAAHPVFALAKVWGSRKLADAQPGTVTHGAAQIASVVF